MQISRIRLSDKTSCRRPRHVQCTDAIVLAGGHLVHFGTGVRHVSGLQIAGAVSPDQCDDLIDPLGAAVGEILKTAGQDRRVTLGLT